MKILHCSDIHLGRRPAGPQGPYSQKRFEDYFKVFEYIINTAIEKNIDVLIISGDLFDKKDLTPDVLEKTINIFRKLKNSGINCILTEGNHDKITDINSSWLIFLENEGYFKIPKVTFSQEDERHIFTAVAIDGINFYALGYSGAYMDKLIDSLTLQLNPDEYNIIIAHTAPVKIEALPGFINPESLMKLKGLTNYFAGGHIHQKLITPSENPFFFCPGSSEYWELDERGKKGFFIHNTVTNATEFFETPKRNIVKMKFNNNFTDEETFKADFTKFCGEIKVLENEDIILLDIGNFTELFIDISWCEEQLEKTNALKAKVNIIYNAFESETINNLSYSAIEITELENIKKWRYFSHFSEKSIETLQYLKKYQEEDNYEDFKFNFDSFLNEIIKQ